MNNRSTQLFLNLFRCYLCGETLPEDARPVSDKELEGVFAIAVQHQVLPMLYDALGHTMPDLDDGMCWQLIRKSALRIVSEQVQRRAEFARVYSELLARGLKPLVVKGIVAAALYPSPDCRTSSDEDLLIDASLQEACAQALCDAGMVALEKEGQVWLFVHRESGLRIELHSALIPEYMTASARMNGWFADASEHAIATEINGATYYTLSYTDHMLYLVCHAFKHFIHSGFGIRQLCDCMLYALAYVAEIDWEVVWNRLKEIRADLFLANLRAISEREFGCDFYNPIMSEYRDRLDPDDLFQDILDAGVYGGSREERKQSSIITLQAANASSVDASEETNVKSGRLAALFPPLATLRGRYPYLKKAPFLLPVAWIQRMFSYMKKRKKGEAASPEAILEVGRSRTQLLIKYGVIDAPGGDN